MKRKKRLEKGVESINKQIALHKEKREVAEKHGEIELTDYYNKEIETLEQTKNKKQKQIKRE